MDNYPYPKMDKVARFSLDVAYDAYKKGNLKEAEEILMTYRGFCPKIPAALDEVRYAIAQEAFSRGNFKDAEDALLRCHDDEKVRDLLDQIRFCAYVQYAFKMGNVKEAVKISKFYPQDSEPVQSFLMEMLYLEARDALMKGCFAEAEDVAMVFQGHELFDDLLNQIKVAKLSPPSYVYQTQHAEKFQEDCNAVLDDILLDPDMANVKLPVDPAIELEEKTNKMIKNSLTMRAIVLRMEVQLAHVHKADNDLHSIDPSMLRSFDDLIRNIETHILTSSKCLVTQNFEDANEHLTKAEAIFAKLCPDQSLKKQAAKASGSNKATNNILNDVKPKNYQPSQRDELTVKGDNVDVMKCLRVAEKAMGDSNFEKAERFLLKAERIVPTSAAKKMLEQMRISKEAKLAAKESAEKAAKGVDKTASLLTATAETGGEVTQKYIPSSSERSEQVNYGVDRKPTPHQSTFAETLKRTNPGTTDASADGKKRRADQCLTQAKEAYSSGDLNAAKKLANKAQQVNPSEEADDFVNKLQTEMAIAEKKEHFKQNMQTSAKRGAEQDNLEKKTECPSSGNSTAEQALQSDRESNNKAENEEQSAALLRALKASRSSTEDTVISYPEEERTPITRKEKNAEMHLSLARNAMEAKDFVKAQKLLNTAYDLNPSNVIHDLLEIVQIEQYSQQTKESPTYDYSHREHHQSRESKKSSFMENVEEANTMCREARNALSENNYDEAERLANASNSLNPNVKAKTLLNNIQYLKLKNETSGHSSDATIKKSNNSKDLNIYDKHDKHETQENIEKIPNDPKIKNNQGSSTRTINYGLSKTGDRASKNDVKKDDDKEAEVEKCINIAMAAVSKEDWERAENFLRKAQRIKPTEKARELLEQVRDGKEQQRIKEENEAKSVNLVASAMKAIDEDDFDFAELILTVAVFKYKSGTAQDLLKRIKTENETGGVQTTSQKRKKTKKNPNPKRTIEQQKAFAGKYFAIAKELKLKGDLENAESILIIAENTYPDVLAKKMLTEIRDELYSRVLNDGVKKPDYEWAFSKTVKEGIASSEAYKSNCYVQMAERLFNVGQYGVAEDFLKEAYALCRNRQIEHLLRQVRSARNATQKK